MGRAGDAGVARRASESIVAEKLDKLPPPPPKKSKEEESAELLKQQ